MLQRITVWDVPTRVFHWLQVLSFGAAYWISDSERMRNYHVALGYILLGLLVFRLLWGFIGSRYARFSSFVFSPRQIIQYLMSMVKRNPVHYLGHNPAGSVSVWLLLGLGLFVCITGVLALQDDASDLVIDMHDWSTDVMLVIIALHLFGVALSSFLHRENLVRAMVTGFKAAEPEAGIRHSYSWLGVLMLAAVVIFWFVYLKKPLG